MKSTIKLFSIIAVLTAFLLASCSKDEDLSPIANFTFSTADTIRYNESVTLNNLSTNADTYLWDFGDGTTSTEKNPTKESFNTKETRLSGSECYLTFTVTLVASKGDKSSTVSKNIVLNYCGEVSPVDPVTPVSPGGATEVPIKK
jgi:hypothetical protein